MARILLIDDDVDLNDMNKAVLVARGFDVTVAYSTDEARKDIARSAPDLIVLDVMMETPTVGFDFAREVHQQHPKMPILMVSGVRDVHELTFSFKPDETWLPVVEFLEKPLGAAALADKIQQTLKAPR